MSFIKFFCRYISDKDYGNDFDGNQVIFNFSDKKMSSFSCMYRTFLRHLLTKTKFEWIVARKYARILAIIESNLKELNVTWIVLNTQELKQETDVFNVQTNTKWNE